MDSSKDRSRGESVMQIEFQTDATVREFIADLAWTIYRGMGYTAPAPTANLMYFFESQHPQEKACVWAAEEIFEILTGDSPEYLDEGELAVADWAVLRGRVRKPGQIQIVDGQMSLLELGK
jgi:hypothetical protein